MPKASGSLIWKHSQKFFHFISDSSRWSQDRYFNTSNVELQLHYHFKKQKKKVATTSRTCNVEKNTTQRRRKKEKKRSYMQWECLEINEYCLNIGSALTKAITSGVFCIFLISHP